MEGTCPNPGCGAAYTISPQNVGKQFACRQCGSVLKIEADGLHMAATAPAPAPTATATTPRAPQDKAFFVIALPGNLQIRIFDLMFGAGALLVIIFTFFPVLDRLRSVRYNADVTSLETEFTRADREKTSPLTPDMQKARDRRLQEVRDSAEDHDHAIRYSGWWYGWGTLFGFVLLAIASIAWMLPSESKTHRVVGAVVICTQLLLVFITYVALAQMSSKL